MDVDARLRDLGIELPDPLGPRGNYVSAVAVGELLFLSGTGPVRPGGGLVTGKVGEGGLDLDTAREAGVSLMLAGHTHCGQIRLPLIGYISTMSDHGDRYACGLIREGGRTLIVSAGLGTSILPLRIGAPPDFWLLDLGPISNDLS